MHKVIENIDMGICNECFSHIEYLAIVMYVIPSIKLMVASRVSISRDGEVGDGYEVE